MKTSTKAANWIVCVAVLSLIGLTLVSGTAHANTVSLTDLQLTQCQVIVYEINDTGSNYVGTFNSTDSVTLNPLSNYVFAFKPTTATYALTSPNGIFGYINENIGSIMQVGIIITILFAFLLVMTWGRR